MPENRDAGPVPIPIVELPEVDSTNAEALRRAASGERGPLWVGAVRQHAGRGRSGRSWASLDGNLMATLLVAPGIAPSRMAELALVAGVAAHDAIRMSQPLASLRLKWPNDILLGDAKVGGVLIESTTFDGAVVAAIGFGINVATAPEIPGRSTTALGRHGSAPTREALLATLSGRAAHWLAVWHASSGFDAVRDAWLERAGPEGETTTVNTGTATHSGAYVGLDHDGALLVRDASGGLRRFAFGDVTVAAEMAPHQRGSHGG